MRRAVSRGAWWLNPSGAAVLSLAPAVVALFICAHQLTLHGVMHGVVIPGESQNLPSSIALTNGALPYDNFALAQPPGMLLLMLPFAWLSHFVAQSVAMTLARFATMFATVVAVYLAGFAARFYGVPAALLAGAFTAVYPYEFFSTAGVTVGPWVLLCTLVGVALAFKDGTLASGGRVAVAGLFLGFACTLKPWAVIPAVVFAGIAIALASRDRGKLVPALGGLAAGIVVPCIVFLLAAPGAFWRDVVVAELPGNGHMSIGGKFATILGLGSSGAARLSHPDGLALFVGVVIIAGIVLVSLGGAASSLSYDWFVAVTAVLVLLAALLPGGMSVQYGEFALPLIAIAVAVALARLLTLTAAAWSGRSEDPRGTLATAVAVMLMACAVVIAAIGAPADAGFAARYANAHGVTETGVVTSHIPHGGCAISNNAMLLVAANRFSEGANACPVVTDPLGAATIGKGVETATTVGDWNIWTGEADYVMFVSPTSDVPFHRIATSFLAHYVPLVRYSLFSIYGHPAA